MNNQKLIYQKDINNIRCESKYSCFYIKNYGTLCPEKNFDLQKVGVYYAPNPKSMGEKDNKDDIFYLNNDPAAKNYSDNKNIHISIKMIDDIWKVELIPCSSDIEKISNVLASENVDKLFKVCRETKLILTRKKSALRICRSVLSHQEPFFSNGIDYINPMSLLDVAFDVSLDESCVSRYSNKIILHTPHGTIKLKYLFNSQGYIGSSQESYSKIAIQMKMKNIVENEEPGKKTSDNKMVDILRKDGINISRRVIAKYRLEMGMPSSFERGAT